MMDSVFQAEWLDAAGLWVGLIFSLLVFSAILGDHLLARLAQYVLVGAVLGYAVAVVWQSVLGMELVGALRADPAGNPWHWVPVGLAAVMLVAGLDRIFTQGRRGPPARGWRRWLRSIGAAPVLLLVAMAVAVAIVGALQGTLAPQFMQAARTGLPWGAPAEVFLTGALTLLLTTAGLVFFVVDADRHLGGQPAWVQRIMRGWIWLGQRAVWLAAGAIFARLIASRLSLFIAELHYLSSTFQATGVGESLAAWWRSMTGF
ncbi:MAG: hypothetical protein M9936_31330 [Caldilinea sp.]|nr:hypothetical protein [Caldilineaceae bacterium]MCB9122566.1 hypothetical protein [Caldilineaceae bacterium]MCB9124766.1 hypothetical protein [Caldilineaceae bacterium]MCO5214215.1 hypothetical protein [Caldilinea sp.]MCW5843647.1 hypothetical protein [Caldilinea sp.]